MYRPPSGYLFYIKESLFRLKMRYVSDPSYSTLDLIKNRVINDSFSKVKKARLSRILTKTIVVGIFFEILYTNSTVL